MRIADICTRDVIQVGADASLQVVPYYNRPTQEGMYRHFRKIAESVNLPVILYNVPGRTVADMSNETMLRLAQVPGIVGVKEATGNIGRDTDLMREVGVPGWKLKTLRQQSHGWDVDGVGRAIRTVARADADVKGQASDPPYALEKMVLDVVRARPRR